MARCARLFIENACYHIIARGSQKRTTFLCDDDFRVYLGAIRRYKFEFGCLIYGYCLMPNHIHLIMEFPMGARSMSMFVHNLNQSYATIFNNKYLQTGHLWQNRYKNYIILKNNYLINVVLYAEFNPVRAGLVSKPEDYAWSSYRARVLGEKNIIIDPFQGNSINSKIIGNGVLLVKGTGVNCARGQV